MMGAHMQTSSPVPVDSLQCKIYLPEAELPTHWHNLALELPFSIPPPLHPYQERPVDADDFRWLWLAECLDTDLRKGRYGSEPRIQIPEPVRQAYRRYRPTPMVRARGLEAYLDTPAEIYYKREDLNPGGSHKFNTAIAQAHYAAQEGIDTLVTDTGAGQWGTALALACSHFGLDAQIFMVRKSFEEKPYRRGLMELLGATVLTSPSERTEVGRRVLREDPGSNGSLGIGMSEAIELVRTNPQYRLALGCMSYHAALHQTIIGLETRSQLELIDRWPDVMIGCVGGGSNFIGFTAPFLFAAPSGRKMEFIAAEPEQVPCLTAGEYRYDWADYNRQTPRLAMYTLGSDFVPPPIHAGGLRYHAKTPVLSALVKHGIVGSHSYPQADVFAAGQLFLRTEGVLPAPESAHAVLATIEVARRAKHEHRRLVIVFCLSGHGYLDLQGYMDVLGRPEHPSS
jgi:tryptophan synthase beta chain